MLRQGWLLPAMFLSLTLPLGLFLAIATPFGGVADELAHAMRAESLSSGQVFAHRGPQVLASGAIQLSSGVDIDVGIARASELAYLATHTNAAEMAKASQAMWAHTRTYVVVTPIAVYFPIFYAPAALGILGVKLVAGGPASAFLAGRLANLATFAALGLAALMLARRGRGVLFCTLALPMTVSLAASFNPDGLLIAASVLAVALLTRAVEPMRADGSSDACAARGSHAGAAAIIGLIALAKFPYAVLAGLLLLPLQPLDRGLLRRVGIAVLAVVPAVVWIAYAMSRIATPVGPIGPTAEYAPGPLWPGPGDVLFHGADSGAQLRVLAAAPLRIVTLTWGTIGHDPWIVRSTIGVLGPLSIPLPEDLYGLWKVALACACGAAALGGGGRWKLRLNWADAVIVAGVICLGVIAIYMSQYLVWTKVGATQVEGPTGRYLLPLFPAIALALPRVRVPGLFGLRCLLLAPACAAALVNLAVVPRAIIGGFYLQ
jgi:uncharacterized membrane protein